MENDKVRRNFEGFVEGDFIAFLQLNGLEGGSVSNGCGDKAIVTRDKHGFFKIKYTKIKEGV